MTIKYKLVILGDTSVGKSSIVQRFAHNSFFEFQEPTIGAAFVCKDIEVDNEKIRVEIWDTAGQERYKSLTPMYFRYANIAIIVFDLTNKDSFEGVKYWMQTLEEKGEPDIFKVLVGNKKDIRNKIEVSNEEIKKYTTIHNILYFETSAKNGSGIETLFTEIFRQDLPTFSYVDPSIMRLNDMSELTNNENKNDNKYLCC